MTSSRTLSGTLATAAASCILLAGCQQSATPAAAPAATPATQPSMVMPEQGRLPAPPTELPKPPAASMTHVLTKDEPFYESQPGADAKSMGTLKAGTKVLLMVPGAPYSKVLTEDGTTVYTVTDGVDPIPMKK